MDKPEKKRFFSLILFVLLLGASCYDRYPYFIQEPEYSVSYPQDGTAGVYLTISTPDPECLIRYTLNEGYPSETYGTLYEEPIYLSEQCYVAAVAYRVGYPAGPVSYYEYDPSNP